MYFDVNSDSPYISSKLSAILKEYGLVIGLDVVVDKNGNEDYSAGFYDDEGEEHYLQDLDATNEAKDFFLSDRAVNNFLENEFREARSKKELERAQMEDMKERDFQEQGYIQRGVL